MPKIIPFLWFDDKAEDAEKSERVMKAMLRMKKIDINGLAQAYRQE